MISWTSTAARLSAEVDAPVRTKSPVKSYRCYTATKSALVIKKLICQYRTYFCVLSIQRRLRVTCVNLREADRLARLRNLFVSDTREQVVLSNLIYFWIDSMAPQMADIRRKQIVSRDSYLFQKTIMCFKRHLFVSKDN